MKIIYQKLALTGVLAALLLSAGCGGAKETSADETAGNVPVSYTHLTLPTKLEV